MSYNASIRSLLFSVCVVAFSLPVVADNSKPKANKDLGEASYNVSDCEPMNEDGKGDLKKQEGDSGVEQKKLDDCTKMSK